jgi:uncharacterized delta-60 repeat protein
MKIRVVFLLCVPFLLHPQAFDYNGNPINRTGGITITSATSSLLLNNYTQALNFDGMIDRTFGAQGIVNTTGKGAGAGEVNAAVLQPDGKIIAAGTTGAIFQLIRYNSNGSLDSSFNGGTPVTTAATNTANAVLLQSDGKIVAGGTNGANFCLVRYNSNGTIDTTFNGGTPVTTAATSIAHAALLQPDGKIVAVGQNATPNFCLVRYNSDGAVDTTFNGGVPVTTAATSIARAAVLQADGKIIVGGQNATPNFCLVRYNSDGTVDATFNGGNPVTTADTTVAYALLLQPDGKIVAIGAGAANFRVTRYNSNGSLDTTFNGGVPVVTLNTTFALAGLLQPDGKIIAGGWNGGGFCLTRYTTTGLLDTTFGPNGTNIVETPGTTDNITALVLQPDNKIIACGNAVLNFDFVLARYINPFTLASFTASYGSIGLI